MSRRVWEKSVERAGLRSEGYSFHHLRHTFASVLISQGRDVSFVSRQLGHANASFTLQVYTHLFDAKQKAEEARAAMQEQFGSVLASSARIAAASTGGKHRAEAVADPRARERSPEPPHLRLAQP